MNFNLRNKKQLKIIKYSIFIFLLWFVFHSTLVTIDGLTDKQQDADVAIVLGNKVNENGIPSERLKARLDKSIDLYKENRVQNIIVSGGFGKEGFWEGTKMKEYLIQHHIPQDKIIVDDYGNDTEQTVENSLKIMDSLGFETAISVSQYFHQTRIKKLFNNKGFIHIESASPQYFEFRDLYSLIREFVAYYKEAI